MSLDKLVLIIVCVLAAAGATMWLSALVLAAVQVPFGWLGLIPAALVGYIAYRVIRDRVTSAEDTHYDRIDH